MLYCRKKFGYNHSVVRKSCAACRKAKVKCDSKSPRCCRCVDKDLVCVYELTRRNENLALQSASPPLDEPRFADAVLLETSKPGGQNYSLWDISPSCNNQALLKSNVDQSRAFTVVPEFLDQDTVFEWEPDGGGVEQLEDSYVGASLYSNGAGNEFSLDWFLSPPLPALSFVSTVRIPADCMFHTPYLVLRPVDFDYPSQSTSLLAPRSPFIPSHLSSGSQLAKPSSCRTYSPTPHFSQIPVYLLSSIPSLYHLKVPASLLQLH